MTDNLRLDLQDDLQEDPGTDPVSEPDPDQLTDPELDFYNANFERRSVMTGGPNRSRYLYYQLKISMARAKRIDIIVSFLMESGVRMILGDLERALNRGAQVRVLTGNYLGITQPSALCLLKKGLGGRVDLRFYEDKGRSFHPKSYIFHYDDYSELYIGSSNVSRSALTSGIEWNYRFTSERDGDSAGGFLRAFEDLFYNHSIVIDDRELKRYSENWHKPAVAKDLDDLEIPEMADDTVQPLFQPRGVQIEALFALRDSRAEGAVKGLVQAATGVGKTYLAAFDSKDFDRVLFVAHREEILRQAEASFRNVRRTGTFGYFKGGQKDTGRDVIFASVASLGQKKYLNEEYFARDYFDYIVIDEFHHAVNKYYRNIADYFQPRFLLGLTATPERMDGRSIYELCDYNVPYEISLRDAINKGMLVPFHYYGIYDDTDYSGLHLVRGHYDEKQLNETYIGNAYRYDLIYRHYRKYGSDRALGFCCSREHAEDMAREFCRRGIPAAAVYSGEYGEFAMDREAAVSKLIRGELRVIFSVDMFNEGVSIDNLDMVLFLRPTESPVVFLQQLGRGLRRCSGKAYLNVLDFIGNYERAGQVRFFLTGRNRQPGTGDNGHYNPAGPDPREASGDPASGTGGPRPFQSAVSRRRSEYPDDCLVDFDMRLIDLFERLAQRKLKVADRIRGEFHRVYDLLGRVPTRMELFTHMNDDIYELCAGRARQNPFRRYLEFLREQNLLTPDEQKLYDSIGRDFLSMLETTSMSKVYKMPVLRAFYNGGDVKMTVTDRDLLIAWRSFFDKGTNWKDFLTLKGIDTYEDYLAKSDAWHLKKIHDMPLRFLLKSGKGFFTEPTPGAESGPANRSEIAETGIGAPGSGPADKPALSLRPELRDIITLDAFRTHMKDIIDYRTMDYYRRRYIDKKDVDTPLRSEDTLSSDSNQT